MVKDGMVNDPISYGTLEWLWDTNKSKSLKALRL